MGTEREVLRDLWRSQEQASALDDDCETTSCRRMIDAGVGFDEFAAGTGQSDLATAWRDRLKREGKYNSSGGTVRDIVLGQPVADPSVTGSRP
jgi:hypothetical protein